MTRLKMIAFIVIVGVAPASAQEKDPQSAFNTNCRQCCTTKEGDNRLGPSLYCIVGKAAGTATNFAYSASLKNSGIKWDEATLDKWITAPDSVIGGNNMKPYAGLTDASTRAAIIAFLKQGAQKK
jgi:cytochrome c